MKKTYQLKDFSLIVFDIDGTLVGDSHQFHPFTRDTLLKLHDFGIPFTLATGKILPATKAQADELRVSLPLILANGSILQRRSGEILYHVYLPEKVTRKVVDICERREENLIIYSDDKIFIKAMNEDIYPIYSMVESGLYQIGEWENLPVGFERATKCLVVNQHDAQSLYQLGEKLAGVLNSQADVVHTSTKLVEVVPKGINKASAVSRLAEELGISMHQVMAFGDYDNDAEMLSAAGLGVAVGNASDSAKAAADIVIGACEENAVADFLRKLMSEIE